ncbi:unnamed protein product [Gemmata massiliana]|uniref:Uncharacterized protein n=1 Tax=Gemmata massiliana TaxID=1210884 RepID=A0A6P2CZA0_9BACT|nr:hypothetical protein [Gemmata massiliana]VTR94311.1 unnamed protein product [Gemmata massiliana]
MWIATLDSPETMVAELVVTGNSPEEALARLDERSRDGEANDEGLAIWVDTRDGRRYVVPAGIEYPLIGRIYEIGKEFPMADVELDEIDAEEAEAE